MEPPNTSITLQDQMNAELRDENARLHQTIREMADDIRSMDQLIYQLGQCWGMNDTAQTIFRGLLDRTNARMRRESDRITDIMRRELLDVYTKRDHTSEGAPRQGPKD